MTKKTKKDPSSATKTTSLSSQSSAKTAVPLVRQLTDQAEPQSMDELLAMTGYKLYGLKRGKEVKGKILSVSPKQILLDIGAKSHAVVSTREMETIGDLVNQLKVGEEVTSTVILPEDEYGQVVVSLRKSSAEKRWQLLQSRQASEEPIDVIGLDMVKGGLLVDFAGIRGFIPSSQLDSASLDNPMALKNRKFSVKILELDQASNRFVVSQKAVTQKDLIASQQKALGTIKTGDTLQATIIGIVPFGAFAQVTVSPTKEAEPVVIEGLIHISEVSWERVENVNSYIKVGDQVNVKVIGKDEESGKLNLSIKQLAKDPWEKVGTTYKQEQTIEGKVTRISHFGVFVQLAPGIEGLIHISKMPAEFAPKVGDTVKATIESIDLEKRKMSLSVVATEKPIGYR